MQIWHYPGDWSHWIASTRTHVGCFYGVAIGPDSYEGQVRVNGMLLQAGRVLPIRSNGESYVVDRYVGAGLNAVNFASVSKLSLMLFESSAELACEVTRPNQDFNSGSVAVALNDSVAYHEVLAVPFTGRRQAFFMLVCDASTAAVNYKVVGRRFDDGEAGVQEFTLSTVASALTGGSNTAFYIGGEDNAECWDELSLRCILAAPGTASVHASAETIGEIGR